MKKPDIVIDKLGTHLFRITNNITKEVSFKWNWDVLVKEVNEATASTDIIKVTENAVKKKRSRSKKSSAV